MFEKPENLTIRLLHETRAEMTDIRTDMTKMRTDLTQRVDRVSEQLRDVKRNGDDNSLLLAGLAGHIRAHEGRIDGLESGKSVT